MRQLTQYQLLYGRDEAPPVMRRLRAGPVELILDGRDVRYARIGGIETVRRIYFAVRDRNWDTIAGDITSFEVADRGDHFEVRFHVRHRRDVIDFEWEGRIRGGQDGKITYAFEGTANSDFDFNRIGICIHEPPSTYAGRPYRGRTPEGPISGVLPDAIAPQCRDEQGRLHGIFPAVNQLVVDLEGGATVRYDFEGDLWELEDHRNWTDNSFKTYCTPLHLPLPQQAKRGQKITQTITVSMERAPSRPAQPRETRGVELVVGKSLGRGLPPIGLGMASHDQELSQREIDRLRELKLDHIRVDVHLRDPHYADQLDKALKLAAALWTRLELAVFLEDGRAATLDQLGALLSGTSVISRTVSKIMGSGRVGTPLADNPGVVRSVAQVMGTDLTAAPLQAGRVEVARVLVFHEAEECTAGKWVELARRHLRDVVGDVPFAGGSNANFTEMNRSRPEVEQMDAVVYPLNGQVHAFDEASLVETITAQPATVRSARLLCGNVPVFVGPVTLKLRFNPNATGPEVKGSANELPPPVDARQMSLFGAAWTVGSIKHLAESGADSLTYFETTGWRGVMESDAGSPQPVVFLSEPGMVFPMYHVFADVAEWNAGELLECRSSDPFSAEGLVVRSGGQVHALVANLTAHPQRIRLTGLQADQMTVRMLDAETAPTALSDPNRFRSLTRSDRLQGGELDIALAPYATARIDAQVEE